MLLRRAPRGLPALIVSVSLLAGCEIARMTNDASDAAPGKGAGDTAAAGDFSSPSGDYHEVLHEDRIYVLGSEESKQAFLSSKDLGVSVRLIGAGPNGETVVIEASDDAALQERLQRQFEARHATN